MNRSKLGVIDALGMGFELVLRAAWLLLIPVALDAFFWLGPRLSVRPLFERLIRFVGQQGLAAAGFEGNLDDMRRLISEVGASFNLFSLLATDILGYRFLPFPSLKAFDLPQANALDVPVVVGNPASVTLESLAQVVPVALVLLLVGLLIGALYLTLIANRVQVAPAPQRSLPRRVLANWLAFVRLVLLLLIAYFVVGIPFTLVFGVASLVNATLGMLVLLVGWVIGIWLMLYLWFAAYAIVIGQAGVVRAMWLSANIVQRNFNSALGLIVVSNLIMAGMTIVWQWLEVSWAGSLIAIVGNAFIGSGLVAAAFLYYQDRVAVWQELAARRAANAG